MSATIAIQISCTLNGRRQNFILDTIEKNVVNASSELTRYPIYTRGYVSDHMYREQSSININGTFSLNGSDKFSLDNSNTKLSTIQRTFEQIKNSCVFCEIVKISSNNNRGLRFLRRGNMVLTSIQWTENINSMDFSLTFTEVLSIGTNTSSTNKAADSNLGISNVNIRHLPKYTEKQAGTFIDVLISIPKICSQINNSLKNINNNTKTLYSKIEQLGTSGLTSLGLANEDVETILSAISLEATLDDGTSILSDGFVETIQNELYLQKSKAQFNLSSFEDKDIVEYCKYLLKIFDKISELREYIEYVKVPTNIEQLNNIIVDNNTYQFEFKQNNTNDKYYLHVTTAYQDVRKYVSTSYLCEASPTTFTNCTLSNVVFKTLYSYVYLLRQKDSDKEDISKYYLLISKINPEQFTNELTMLIKEGLYF